MNVMPEVSIGSFIEPSRPRRRRWMTTATEATWNYKSLDGTPLVLQVKGRAANRGQPSPSRPLAKRPSCLLRESQRSATPTKKHRRLHDLRARRRVHFEGANHRARFEAGRR